MMPFGDRQAMWDTISGYLYSLIFGGVALAVAGWLLVTGQVIDSIDDLFLVLVCGLFVVICFGYLGWRIKVALDAGGDPNKKA